MIPEPKPNTVRAVSACIGFLYAPFIFGEAMVDGSVFGVVFALVAEVLFYLVLNEETQRYDGIRGGSKSRQRSHEPNHW